MITLAVSATVFEILTLLKLEIAEFSHPTLLWRPLAAERH